MELQTGISSTLFVFVQLTQILSSWWESIRNFCSVFKGRKVRLFPSTWRPGQQAYLVCRWRSEVKRRSPGRRGPVILWFQRRLKIQQWERWTEAGQKTWSRLVQNLIKYRRQWPRYGGSKLPTSKLNDRYSTLMFINPSWSEFLFGSVFVYFCLFTSPLTVLLIHF